MSKSAKWFEEAKDAVLFNIRRRAAEILAAEKLGNTYEVAAFRRALDASWGMYERLCREHDSI